MINTLLPIPPKLETPEKAVTPRELNLLIEFCSKITLEFATNLRKFNHVVNLSTL